MDNKETIDKITQVSRETGAVNERVRIMEALEKFNWNHDSKLGDFISRKAILEIVSPK